MVDQIEIRTAGPLTVVGRQYELTFEEFRRVSELASEALEKSHEFLKNCGSRPSAPNVFEYRFHDSPHGPRRIRAGRFTLTVGEPHRALPSLLDYTRSADVKLAGLTTRTATLEDVFVTLTGRHLRDDA